jgi:hypothetical protein
MRDYRIVKFNNGDSIFCIVEYESEDLLTVAFPMLIKEHSFVLGPNVVRETYSATQLCPFTDDRVFSFYKPELLFIKPMNTEAIPYYINLLNKNETIDMLRKYNLHEIIDEKVIEEEMEMVRQLESRIDELSNELGEVEEEEDQSRNVVTGNKTVH